MTLTNPVHPHVIKTVSVDSTNAASISIEDWIRHDMFVLSDASASVPTANVTITVPAIARHAVVFKNTLSFDADVTVSGQSDDVAQIAAGALEMVTNDGSNARQASPELPPIRGCRVKLSAALTAQNLTTLAALDFDAEDFDTDGFHEGVTNPSRITVPEKYNGYWAEIGGYVGLLSVAADDAVRIQILHTDVSDTPVQAWTLNVESGNTTAGGTVTVPGLIQLTTGDYFELLVDTEVDTSVTVSSTSALSLIIRGKAPATV